MFQFTKKTRTAPRKAFRTSLGVMLICLILLSAVGCDIPIEIITPDKSVAETASEAQSESRDTHDEELYTAETAEYIYHIPERYYSEGIKNIVRRARQIYEMKWVPLSDLTGFNGDYVFPKGIEITGIPYGQPVYSGLFVGYEATVEEFYEQSRIKNSVFYTDYSEYEEISTYYSLDCTTFVCYAWNTDVRMYTSVLVQFGDYVSKKTSNLQVGDAVIRTGDNAHAVLVTGIVEDERGNVVWLEIIEQTPPLTKLTRYGEGELYSIEEFTKWYLDDGYGIYRNTDYRDSTLYTPFDAVPLDGEKNGSTAPYRKLTTDVSNGEIRINGVFACDESLKDFSYIITPYFYGLEKYKTRDDSSIRLRETPKDGETLDYIPPGTVLTVMEKYTDSGGEQWGKLRYNGNCGWIWLEGSQLLGGSLDSCDSISVNGESCRTQTVEGYRYAGMACDIIIPDDTFNGNSLVAVTVYAHASSGNAYKVGTVYVRLTGK
ncbi:MAG: hypothetical protein PHW77_02535 [Eubacteriales bacterium]|nr:hypothetical protein [Eubacteriales bacterium]